MANKDIYLILLISFIVFVIILLLGKYFILKFKELDSKRIEQELENLFILRFKIIENIFLLSKSKIDYEQSLFKDIFELRSFSQTNKEKKNLLKTIEIEDKIEKISLVPLNLQEVEQSINIDIIEKIKKELLNINEQIRQKKIAYKNNTYQINQLKNNMILKLFRN